MTVSDVDSLQADWDQISYFVKGRMNELTKDVNDGKGHRMLPGILYALFSNTVEYDPTFKSIKEAFISAISRKLPQKSCFKMTPQVPNSWHHLTAARVWCN